MARVPHWCRWSLGSLGLLAVIGATVLVPIIQDARNAARKSADK